MSNPSRYTVHPFILIISFFLHAKSVLASPSPSNDPHPLLHRTNQEASSEIKCYGLPYGGIGFLSHILTYYSIICIGVGVRPLLPRMHLRHSIFDLVVAICSLLGSSINAIVVMARCRREWQFLLLALWKLGLSCTLGCMCIHRALLVRHADEIKNSKRPFFWLFVYVTSIVLGLAGLFSLVRRSWDNPHVRTVTIAFWGIAGGLAFIKALFPQTSITETEVEWERDDFVAYLQRWLGQDTRETYTVVVESRSWGFGQWLQSLFASAILLTVLLAPLYSDWVLGVITGNLAGAPSGNVKVIYWIYFVAKRLPLIFQ